MVQFNTVYLPRYAPACLSDICARQINAIRLKLNKMDRFTPLLDQLMRDGRSLEDGLSQLRAEGAAPVEAIKAIHLAQCVNLAEAKLLFASSQAWAKEAAAGAALHEETIAHLKLESSQ